MAKSKPETPAAADGAPVPGKGKLKKIIFIVVGIVLVLIISLGATWYILHRNPKPADPAAVAEAAAQKANVKKAAVYEAMAPAFVVNFTQNGRQRYMQVSITLMARDAGELDELKVHMPVIRNNLVMLFSAQTFESLATPIGEEMLRQKALVTVQEVAQKETGKLVVEQLLFTNFVLQ